VQYGRCGARRTRELKWWLGARELGERRAGNRGQQSNRMERLFHKDLSLFRFIVPLFHAAVLAVITPRRPDLQDDVVDTAGLFGPVGHLRGQINSDYTGWLEGDWLE
jgi:hypothetical protein